MSIISPEGFLQKAASNQAAQQKAALDSAEVVANHDALAKKIVADLVQAEADLDNLQVFYDLVVNQGKENAQLIHGLLTMHVVGNIPTVKALIACARESIVTKG
jgi:hypothetical protein